MINKLHTTPSHESQMQSLFGAINALADQMGRMETR